MPLVVAERLSTEPPLPPLPVAPEFPDVAADLQFAVPSTAIAVQSAEFPPVEPELPEAPPLPPVLVLLLFAAPPLPPCPPSPVFVDELLLLDEFDVVSPPDVLEPACELPPFTSASSVCTIDVSAFWGSLAVACRRAPLTG